MTSLESSRESRVGVFNILDLVVSSAGNQDISELSAPSVVYHWKIWVIGLGEDFREAGLSNRQNPPVSAQTTV